MIVAIARHDIFLLNWTHVLSGALWTGADLAKAAILASTRACTASISLAQGPAWLSDMNAGNTHSTSKRSMVMIRSPLMTNTLPQSIQLAFREFIVLAAEPLPHQGASRDLSRLRPLRGQA
jgi:hypothetical protein